MRDTTIMFDATKAGTATHIPPSGTLNHELAARLRLSYALQASLDPTEVLRHFHAHAYTVIDILGIVFRTGDQYPEIKLGRMGVHHCDYRLATDGEFIGHIILCRNKRFAETELATLEALLGSLAYPLRNAFRYQSALRLAMLDPLTMVGNRAALDTALRRELQLAERHQHDLSVLMIDADHFKRINDDFGHHGGDLMLCSIAKGIESVCRGSDTIFRYGGEEFMVVLGKTHAEGAKIIAERIRQQIEATSINHNGRLISTTVSIGIATRQMDRKEQISDLFDRADTALYQAKNNGRNCVASSAG